MPMRLYYTVSLVFLLSSCATPDPASVPAVQESSAKAPSGRIESQPLKHLLGRNLKPIPDRPLEVRTKCSFRDVAGGRGSMDLLVSKAEVRRFVAEVNIPKHGICRFDMKSLQQTSKMPNVVLTDSGAGCVVRMWEQEKAVTVAFNGCQDKCSGDAFSYLWPILVDTRNGRCS